MDVSTNVRSDSALRIHPRRGPKPTYSVVVPVYRSARILPDLVRRLDAFFDKYSLAHEYIFVNDGSPDDSWRVLERLKHGRDDLVIIDLMRNCGQHSAVLCGLEHATGDFVITMDDDLQNPPEEIIHLILKAEEGHDVVIGAFRQKMHGPVRKLGSRLIGWLNARLFQKPPDLVLTNFRLLRREVVEAICECRTSSPYIPGLVLQTARTFANVPVEHHPRRVGRSNYTVGVILRLVCRIVFNYSTLPVRVLCAVGGLSVLASLALGGYSLAHSWVAASGAPAWAIVAVLFAFSQGMVLMLFAVMGEYVMRIRKDILSVRPYRVRRKL